MNNAIKELRKFFKSNIWSEACFDNEQPIISDKGILCSELKINGVPVCIDAKINLALKFEGDFNEMAHKYMQYRKDNNLNESL